LYFSTAFSRNPGNSNTNSSSFASDCRLRPLAARISPLKVSRVSMRLTEDVLRTLPPLYLAMSISISEVDVPRMRGRQSIYTSLLFCNLLS
jgi:hypothetical protein